ncbi:MAG: hypothetical protein PHF67_01135 [Candidatus Nanoarchaeia archaeon]|nr:hypothetical protein [Candidatus Nanoarchaeia archaeon]
MKNILFVCKYNRFRSRIAEAYFKKINKKLKCSSAGLIKGNPIDPQIIKTAKKLELKINGTPRALSSKLLKKQDLIVIVADNVPKSLFKNKTILIKVKDIESNDKIKIEKKILEIMKKIKILNKNINKILR